MLWLPAKPIWRPRWQRMLMSHLQLKTGHLARTATNHLAFCDDACCSQFSSRSVTLAFSTCCSSADGTYSGMPCGPAPVGLSGWQAVAYSTPCPQLEATVSATACHSQAITGGTRYVEPRGKIEYWMNGSLATVEITVRMYWNYWHFTPACSAFGLWGMSQNFVLTRATCNSGALTVASTGAVIGPSGHTFPGCTISSASCTLTI